MEKGSMKRSVKALAVVGLGVTLVVGALAMPGTDEALAAKKKAPKKKAVVVKNAPPVVKPKNAVATAALIKALTSGEKDVSTNVKQQLGSNADPNVKDDQGRAAIIWAAKNGDTASLKALIAAKANVNAVDAEKKSAMMWAAMVGRLDMVQALLAAKADAKALDIDGNTALLMACKRNPGSWSSESEDMVRSLVASGSAVNVKDKNGLSPLYFAAVNGSPKTVKFLIDAKADVKAVNPANSETILMAACQVADNNDFVEIIKLLNSAGVDINAKDAKGNTALILTAGKGMPRICETLIGLKADVNARNTKGESALEMAFRVSNLQAITMLQSKGAQR